MHGLGNNYVYFNCFDNTHFNEASLPDLAKAISNVNTGIGSDGIILIGPSHKASVKMRIFNKDGSEAKNCGNGLRCVAKYAYENGYAKEKSFPIETLGGIVYATVVETNSLVTTVSIDMGIPRLCRSDIPMIGPEASHVVSEPFILHDKTLLLTAVSVGNPHAVFFTPEREHHLHAALGPSIENDSRFPEGINVEFVTVESSVLLHCKVWERGSGITQACGTGACACVVAAVLNGLCPKDQDISVYLTGGVLKIRWCHHGHLMMTGPAETIASGTLYL